MKSITDCKIDSLTSIILLQHLFMCPEEWNSSMSFELITLNLKRAAKQFGGSTEYNRVA